MTVLPEISQALTAAAERQAETSVRRRRAARGTAVAAVCTVGAASAAAASGIWSPPIGDDSRGHPTISPSSPPAEQLERFAVLRRKPTDADRGAQALYALRFQGDSMKGVRTEHIRLLATRSDGRGSVLIPAREGYGKPDALCVFDQDADGGGQSCWTTQDIDRGIAVIGSSPAIPALPAKAPGAMVPRASRPEDRAVPQLLRRTRPIRPFARQGDDGRGSHLSRQLLRPPVAGGRLSGLVPDGVASVRVGDAAPVTVRDNFFSAPWSPSPSQGGVGDVTWLDAEGRVVPHP